LENKDAYRDDGMGEVIFGKPFLREVGIKIRRFDGLITLSKGDDEVTYQMVRSHSRFRNLSNEQCNKIPPLLKVSHLRVDGDHHEEKVNEKRKIYNFAPELWMSPIKEISMNRESEGDDESKP
nr:hypothetical protein [Tanacetum cinerariifolium]